MPGLRRARDLPQPQAREPLDVPDVLLARPEAPRRARRAQRDSGSQRVEPDVQGKEASVIAMTLERLFPRTRYAVVRIEANGKREASSLWATERMARDAARQHNAILGSERGVRYEAVRVKRADEKKGAGR